MRIQSDACAFMYIREHVTTRHKSLRLERQARIVAARMIKFPRFLGKAQIPSAFSVFFERSPWIPRRGRAKMLITLTLRRQVCVCHISGNDSTPEQPLSLKDGQVLKIR